MCSLRAIQIACILYVTLSRRSPKWGELYPEIDILIMSFQIVKNKNHKKKTFFI